MQIHTKDPDWFRTLAERIRHRLQLGPTVDIAFVVDGKEVYP